MPSLPCFPRARSHPATTATSRPNAAERCRSRLSTIRGPQVTVGSVAPRAGSGASKSPAERGAGRAHVHQAKALVMDLMHRVGVDMYGDAFFVGSSGTPWPGSA
jgi:hypothetical protein